MKRLLVLFVVISLANTALGGEIDIMITSLNGTPIAPVSEITVQPSDTVDLAIVWNGLTGRYLFTISTIIQKTGPGTLNLNSTVTNPNFEPTMELKGTTGGQQWIAEVPSITIGYGLGVPGITSQTQPCVSNILLHCDGTGNTIIKLLDYVNVVYGVGSLESDFQPNWFYPTYGSGVIIHQVPEPATLLLLGLGGLFLRRRK